MAGGPGPRWRLLPSPVLSSAPGAARMQAVKPLGTGGVGVWAANKGVPGEGWSTRPPPGAPALGIYSPHPGT